MIGVNKEHKLIIIIIMMLRLCYLDLPVHGGSA